MRKCKRSRRHFRVASLDKRPGSVTGPSEGHPIRGTELISAKSKLSRARACLLVLFFLGKVDGGKFAHGFRCETRDTCEASGIPSRRATYIHIRWNQWPNFEVKKAGSFHLSRFFSISLFFYLHHFQELNEVVLKEQKRACRVGILE
jgi:hypothetical protein